METGVASDLPPVSEEPVVGADATLDENAPMEESASNEALPVTLDPLELLKDLRIKPLVAIPDDIEVSKAKSFLKTAADGKKSVYEHLANVVMRILETRPANALGN
jgi:hypothetical protein